MADNIAIKVEHVQKTFKLPHEKSSSIKSALVSFGKARRGYEKQTVLRDVSFDIKKGEFFGIVGRNGSGKSTLLKVLAGIYAPSKGGVHVEGKLTPFIELGVGFNPELTGRENVYLNGALLGFNRAEMNDMYDDIVRFAELEKFMDQKLKNYSSGMQVRLAFSIAIRAKSDILVLDEVLAVGDEAFQRKCLDVFERYKAEKQTIVLVTHDMATVKKYCTRAILIHDGEILTQGDPHKVAEMYSRLNQDSVDAFTTVKNNMSDKGFGLSLCDKSGKPSTRFTSGDTMKVAIAWEADAVQTIGAALFTSTGECVFATNTHVDGIAVQGNHAEYAVELALGPGRYYVMAGTFSDDGSTVIDFISHGPDFTIQDTRKSGDKWEGIVHLTHNWGNK